jgi:hypothetical protein
MTVRMYARLLALVFLVAGCKLGGGSRGEGGGPGSPGLTASAIETTTQWDGGTLSGKVKNLTDLKISSVTLHFDLVDERQMPVLSDITIKNEDGIEPRGDWDFQVAASAIGARSVRLMRTEIR